MDKYIIIKSQTLENLELEVCAAIDAGYETAGGPFTTGVYWKDFCQAMVLKEQIQPPPNVKVGPMEFKSKSKN